MPLARFYLYARAWTSGPRPRWPAATAGSPTMRHIAREGRCYVIGVNPCLHVDQIPADFPHRDQVWPVGRTATGVGRARQQRDRRPERRLLAGPARHEETILYAEVDLAAVRAARRLFDPVGHYHRPDIFRLTVDTRPRPPVVLRGAPAEMSEPAGAWPSDTA